MPTSTDPIDDVPYPPAPWDLQGHMTVLLWLVPTSLVADRLPPGTRPLSMAGRSVLGTAWVAYTEGSLVSYGELLAAVHVWDGRALRQTVTDIWVDNPVSVAGGRALWAIPKDLARFPVLDGRTFAVAPWAEGAAPARIGTAASFRPLATLPLRVRAGWRMVQDRDGQSVTSRVRLAGRPSIGRGRMQVLPEGHLGFLAGRRPFAALQLRDLDITFG